MDLFMSCSGYNQTRPVAMAGQTGGAIRVVLDLLPACR